MERHVSHYPETRFDTFDLNLPALLRQTAAGTLARLRSWRAWAPAVSARIGRGRAKIGECPIAPEALGGGTTRHMMTRIPGGLRVEFIAPAAA